MRAVLKAQRSADFRVAQLPGLIEETCQNYDWLGGFDHHERQLHPQVVVPPEVRR